MPAPRLDLGSIGKKLRRGGGWFAVPKLTILGGSSPFTVALLDEFAAAQETLRPFRIVLYGRNPDALVLISAYAKQALARFGWETAWTTDLTEALEGTHVVLHQIRYGGLDGRATDEAFSAAFDLPADETLGPAGLRSAIRMLPELRRVASTLLRSCPDALVLNLTNPLSISTKMLSDWGMTRTIGLCELPLATLDQACLELDLSRSAVEWDYVGLNHRGFIHVLRSDGEDAMAKLALGLGDRCLGGIRADDIKELHAVPLKYFRLFRSRPQSAPSRAVFLTALRGAILEELVEAPARSPPSLRKRDLCWYREAVVPAVRAVTKEQPEIHVLNLMASDGLVREYKAKLCGGGIDGLEAVAPDRAVRRWLELFEEHERRVVEAARNPSAKNLEAALSADPMVPEGSVGPIAAQLVREGRTGREEPG